MILLLLIVLGLIARASVALQYYVAVASGNDSQTIPVDSRARGPPH